MKFRITPALIGLGFLMSSCVGDWYAPEVPNRPLTEVTFEDDDDVSPYMRMTYGDDLLTQFQFSFGFGGFLVYNIDHDEQGKITRISTADNSDGLDEVYTFYYDGRNLDSVVCVRDVLFNSDNTEVTYTFVYDGAKLMTVVGEVAPANGDRYTLEYRLTWDGRNVARITQWEDEGSGFVLQNSTEYTYADTRNAYDGLEGVFLLMINSRIHMPLSRDHVSGITITDEDGFVTYQTDVATVLGDRDMPQQDQLRYPNSTATYNLIFTYDE